MKKQFNPNKPTFAALSREPSFINLSTGNKKLISVSGKYQFLIWNLPAVITCPYATEHCIKFCYARKSETAYPNVIQCRKQNYALSLQNDFVYRMCKTIDGLMLLPKYKNVPVYFRIHESGDFYSKEYFIKWIQIINHCKKYSNLHFCAYTKSIDFLPHTEYKYFKESFNNFVVNVSVWDDSPKEVLQFINDYKYPVYTAATKEEMPQLLKNSNNKKCVCSNCAKCKMCLINHNTELTKICEIH